ncbi:MAG: hypothetical protein M3541_22790 [Acidobacteriota bacterium]|nr:hypothetical protein [Acidobacteriota bacterium]MDQ3421561.1 hypothetical protein [Acidobacteriota bacterium]
MSLPRLARAAGELLHFLERKNRPACVIGGIVVSRWGEPRATTDVDVTVLAEFGDERAVLGDLLSEYQSRIPNPETFADANRIALLRLPPDLNADVSLAAFPFELEVLQRATMWRLSEGLSIRTCSAEDLIIYKLVAGRPGDIQDIIGIVARQGRKLDAARVRHWGAAFADLKEDPDLLRPFEDALKKAGPHP